MGMEPIPPVKQPITIDTMLNFDGDGVGMCKQNLRPRSLIVSHLWSEALLTREFAARLRIRTDLFPCIFAINSGWNRGTRRYCYLA